MNEMIKESQIFWDDMAKHGPDASVADTRDSKGYKNQYVASIEHLAICDELTDLSPSARILDFGCGSGNLSIKLDDIGYRPTGVDLSFNLLKYTQRHIFKEPALFVQYDGKSLPYHSEFFEACVTNGVLQFVIDDNLFCQTLEELFRVLKPGGLLVTSEQTCQRSVYQANKKKLLRSEKEIVQLFSKSGFQIKKSSAIRRGHFPLIYLIRYGFIHPSLFPYIGKVEAFWGQVFGQPFIDHASTIFVAEKPS